MPPLGGMPSISGSSSQEQNASLDAGFTWTAPVTINNRASGLPGWVWGVIAAGALGLAFLFFRR